MAHFTDTVTLLHWSGTAYEAQIINGAQWRERMNEVVDASGIITYQKQLSITIPYANAPTIVLEPRTGVDVCLYGSQPESAAMTPSQLANTQGIKCGTVYAVIDNTHRDKLKHWRIYAK